MRPAKSFIIVLSAVLLLPFSDADAAVILHSTSSDFAIFGTVAGPLDGSAAITDDVTEVVIGRLPTFDPTLGILTGVKIYTSLRGSYAIRSHCFRAIPGCGFTATANFGDSFDIGPAGSVEKFRAANSPTNPNLIGYSVRNFDGLLTLHGACETFSITCVRNKSGAIDYSKQVIIDPADFDDYLLTDTRTRIVFAKEGNKRLPRVEVAHDATFGRRNAVIDACLDGCGDGFLLLSLAAYIAEATHVTYNDTHYKFSGSRYFQVDYEYTPFANAVPAPAGLPFFGAGLVLLGWIRHRRVSTPA